MAQISATATSALEERLRFETMLADLSSRFVNVTPGEVDREIEDAQRMVCECLELDVSALWQRSAEGPDNYLLTHLYRALGGPPVPDVMDAKDFFPWCLEQILSGGLVSLSSVADAPREAVRDREVWAHYGIKSVLGIPLRTGGGPLVGVLTFDTMREERSWPDEIVQRLHLIAEVFANALAHKRSDLLLSESEERLHLAAESGDVGMWMLDAEGESFWATERARDIFGYEPGSDITMARFVESVHPDHRHEVQDTVRFALEQGGEIDVEYRILLPDGSERWVQSRGRMQPAAGELPLRLLGSTVDVTERRRSEEELRQSLDEVKKLRSQLEAENAYLLHEHQLQHGRGRIVGESSTIMEVLSLVEQVAPTKSSVLIEGETGTGKELVAQHIHDLSPRQDRPMIKVNCAALPSTLVESELFGREKGAYTGAVSRELGRFEVANGSTLFLDEIAELPLELQSKLLRVLEQGQFERVGSPRTIETDVRVIAATNRDLWAEVEAGRFRRDLYFRLAVFPIRVPPLRERREDISLLVWAVVRELSSEMNKAVETIRRQDMDRLESYGWPGNVRELRNVVERAMILGTGTTLRVEPPDRPPAENGNDFSVLPMDEMQRRHILKALEAAGGRIRGPGGAAELLGMKRSTLRSRMERLGLDPKQLRGG